MKSKVKMKLSGKTKDGWYPWFAWRPIKITIPIVEANDPDRDRAWVLVWLEYVEWRHAKHPEPGIFRYRMKDPST